MSDPNYQISSPSFLFSRVWIGLEYFFFLLLAAAVNFFLNDLVLVICVAIVLLLYVIVLLRLDGDSKSKYGVTTNNWFESLRPYLFGYLITTLFIFALPFFFSAQTIELTRIDTISKAYSEKELYWGLLLFAPLQEFVFRSFLTARLRTLTNQPLNLILLGLFVFCVPYLWTSPIVFLGFVASGFVLACIYHKHQNFLLSMSFHVLALVFMMVWFSVWTS